MRVRAGSGRGTPGKRRPAAHPRSPRCRRDRRRPARARAGVRGACTPRAASTWSPPSRSRRRSTEWSTRAGATSISSSAPTDASWRAGSAIWTATARTRTATWGDPLVWERVETYLRDDVGADARVSHRWTGVVGFSDDLLPYVGEVPGRPRLYVSGGYSGHGTCPASCAVKTSPTRSQVTVRSLLFPRTGSAPQRPEHGRLKARRASARRGAGAVRVAVEADRHGGRAHPRRGPLGPEAELAVSVQAPARGPDAPVGDHDPHRHRAAAPLTRGDAPRCQPSRRWLSGAAPG